MFSAEAHILDETSGHFVSQKHMDIATVINEWNPSIHLVWIPPKDRETEDDRKYPFAVVHMQGDGRQYVIFRVSENELDERIIARLWASDNSRHNVLANIEAEEAAREALRLRRQMEEEEARRDLVGSILKSPKNVYRHNGIEYRD